MMLHLFLPGTLYSFSSTQNEAGRTPLHEVIPGRIDRINKFYIYKEVAELLITKGAVVDAKDNNGRTPLHEAIRGTVVYRLEGSHGYSTTNELAEYAVVKCARRSQLGSSETID